ncbi:MAG: IS1182 family transposase [Clostridiaceae bacterium]
MLRIDNDKQQKLEIVMIENLVPQDHLLRIIDKRIDFSFIRDLTKDKYCENNGRPALDPVKFFKILFIGYLFGIRSERQLVKEIEVNVAYRWFLGMSLTDKVIDHSTLSKTRQRKYKDVNIFEEIFNHIVRIAIDKKLVKGNTLYIDSTHLKANANNKKFVKVEIEKSVKSYVDDLEKAINEEREKHGKKPLKEKEIKPEIKETKKSTTDPESGYMYRDNKPEGFFYLEHRTVDSRANIILDVHVTPGNVNDADFLIPRVDAIIEKFSLTPKYVGADAGYFVNHVCKEINDRTLKGVIAYRRSPHQKGKFTKNKFIYDNEKDVYLCPAEKELTYKTTTREGYSEYVCKKEICSDCHLKEKCLPSKSEFKTVRRHVWEKYKELVKEFLRTEKGKGLYKRRKETVERSFADSKNLHGLRYCRMRGTVRVQEQCFLTAACQNMKKIARVLTHRGLPRLFKEGFNFMISNMFFSQAIA